MKRYQVYLNQNSVSVLAEQLVRVVDDRRLQKKEYILDSLNGFVDLKTNKKTNFAQEVDEIYFSN